VSVGSRAPIVATVITLLIAPAATDDDGPRLRHKVKKAQVHTLRCVRGKPIPATPLARRLGLVGDTCKDRIVRRVRVKSRR
jgi:hypothetical protein